MSDFIDEAIAAANLTLTAEKTGPNAYHCTLVSDYGQMVRDITVRKAAPNAPTIGNLVYYFAVQAQSVIDYDDFEEWADDEGFENFDPQARKNYEQHCKDARELRVLFGDEAFQNLMGALAIHQAISKAFPG